MKRTLLHWSTHETRTNANNGKTKYRTHCGRWLLPTSITLQDPASDWVQKFSGKFCDRCKSRLSRYASQ
jgi:hypothetical protein